MMSHNIRQATDHDLESIRSLVIELAIYEKEEDAVTADLSHYREQYDLGRFDALVAEIDGRIVGMALYYDTFSTWRGSMLHLEDFYVQPAYRSQGIGKELFDAYIATAKRKGCRIAKWEVLDWNTKAQAFYLREGATIEKQWYNGKIIFD